MTNYLAQIATVLVLLFTHVTGWAGTDLQDIRQQVHRFVNNELAARHIVTNQNQQVQVQIMGLDPRLKLSTCEQPLVVSAKSERWIGRINTRVDCQGVAPWSIYVPVRVRLTKEILVANRHLARGSTIAQADIRRMVMDVTDYPRGYFTTPSQITGMELRRAVATNNPISPAHVQAALTVKRGDEVSIVANTGGLTIRSIGVALTDGRLGQQIRVKNRASKRIIKALVVERGLVKVLI